MVIEGMNGFVQMVRPVGGYGLWVYIGGVSVQIGCAEPFETAEEEVIRALDEAVNPGRIFSGGDVLDLLFGAVVVDDVTVKVLPAIAHESMWGSIVEADPAK